MEWPLFIPPVDTIINIQFPSLGLPVNLTQLAKWLNLYDPDDVLDYPLERAE